MQTVRVSPHRRRNIDDDALDPNTHGDSFNGFDHEYGHIPRSVQRNGPRISQSNLLSEVISSTNAPLDNISVTSQSLTVFSR